MDYEKVTAEEFIQLTTYTFANLLKFPGPGKEALLPNFQDLTPEVQAYFKEMAAEDGYAVTLVGDYAIIKNNNPKKKLTDRLLSILVPRL